MNELACTLLADGPSDSVLEKLLRWLLEEHAPSTAVNIHFEARKQLTSRGFSSYPQCIKAAVDLYPCDILFLHRDTERMSRADRVREITQAVQEAELASQVHVCVIPVRMTEAWFLFREQAIREVAGNPNGKIPLTLPRLSRVENLPNPKKTLEELIEKASELSGRRLKKDRSRFQKNNLSNFIYDYTPLRRVSAFQALEEDIRRALSCLLETNEN